MLMVIVIAGVAICLGLGIALGEMTLVWCALAASLVGALAMAVLILRRRKASPTGTTAEPTPAEPTPAEAATAKQASADTADQPVAADATGASPAEPVAESGEASDTVEPAAAGEPGTSRTAAVPAAQGTNGSAATDTAPTLDQASSVLVVPGRQRFHKPDCRLLAGKASEEISLDEATEEGFSACTVCIPQRDQLSRASDGARGTSG